MQSAKRLSSEKIVNAAIKIIQAEEKGAVTFARVSKELGSKPQALYLYFDNQEKLLEEIAKKFFCDLFNSVINNIVGMSGEEAIIALAYATRDYCLANQGLTQVALLKIESSEVKKTAEPLVTLLHKLLESIYQEEKTRALIVRAIRNQIAGEILNESFGMFTNPAIARTESFEYGIRILLKSARTV